MFKKSDYGMSVEVERDVNGKLSLLISVDVETAEFIVNELPTEDEVTRLIALGTCELVLADVPASRHVVAMDNRSKL